MRRKILRAKFLAYPIAAVLFAGLAGCGPYDAGSDWNGQAYVTGDAAAIYNRCYGPDDQSFAGGIDHGNPGGYHDRGYDHGRDHDNRDHGGGIPHDSPGREAPGREEHITSGGGAESHAVASGGEDHSARGGTESAGGTRR